MPKESKELTVDNKAEDRGQWVKLLQHASMFHKQMVAETHNEIIGAEPSQDNLFHRAVASAIDDAVLLIQIAGEQGMFDDMPQYNKGPAG
tara:strand:- start:154 stop:423 length:270 start_codon:yes stop_codon:yes gene_type:complete